MAVLAGHFPQTSQVVIPAKAGIHVEQSFDGWVPACAGTTALAFSALLVGAVRLSFGFRPLLGRLTFLVSTRKVSKRNDPGGAGWRCAPTTLLCSGFAGALELARYAGSNRQGPFFRKTFRASAAPTGNCGSAASDWLGSRVAGRASQDLAPHNECMAGEAGRGMDAEASIVRPGMACRWTPDKSEKRRAPPQRAGRPGAPNMGAALGYFSLRTQREVTRPSKGRNPRQNSALLSSSRQPHNQVGTRTA